MAPYLIIFAILSFYSLKDLYKKSKFLEGEFYISGTIILLLMGLRENIGCDWKSYNLIFEEVSHPILDEKYISSFLELGFLYLNKAIFLIGGSFNSLIFITSLLFLIPLMIFCKRQPLPFLALTIAFPYFIVVVGMGFIRQAIAISIILLSIIQFEESRPFRYFLSTSIASLFHKTSLIFLFPGLFLFRNPDPAKRIRYIAAICIAISTIFFILLSNKFKIYDYFLIILNYYLNYKEIEDRSATGAIYFLLLNLVPSVLYLLKYKQISPNINARIMWTILSYLSLASLPVLLLLKPTLTYRLSLYLIPIQIYVGSNLPDLKLFSLSKKVWTTIIIVYSFITMYIWLSFANHASCWVPYKSILF